MRVICCSESPRASSLPSICSRILYLDHVENDGRLLFEQIVKMDLEGMVCKRKSSPYRVTEKPSPYWIKVKNRRYSQAEGREELFERNF